MRRHPEIEALLECRRQQEESGLREPHVRIADVFRPLVYYVIWATIIVAVSASFVLLAAFASALRY